MATGFEGFRQVGEFAQPRGLIRTVRNPMDKATIVSIYPKDIYDVKHTTQPSKYYIKGGSFEKPSLTVVGPASWWRDVDPDQPMLEVPVAATQVAHSLIVDYIQGFLACDMEDNRPGLFFIPGEITLKVLQSEYALKLKEAYDKQRNWYALLLRLADSLWARSNGNPLAIWDEMRMAARELGLDNRPWLKLDVQVEMTRCFACGSLRNPEFPICPTCKNIDTTHPRAGEIKLAAG